MDAWTYPGTDSLDGTVAMVDVVGDLDMATAGSLATTVRRAGARGAAAVVINLTDCPFIDSTGMSALLELDGELGERDVRLLVVLPAEPKARRRTIAIAGLERTLSIVDDEDSAFDDLSEDGLTDPRVSRRELRL